MAHNHLFSLERYQGPLFIKKGEHNEIHYQAPVSGAERIIMSYPKDRYERFLISKRLGEKRAKGFFLKFS
jgi:hypothetical protein